MSEQTGWIYLSYAKGRIGIRIEPKDDARVSAFKAAVPEESRFYKRETREWCFDPSYCPEVLGVIREFCNGYDMILEETNADLLETLLVGPASLLKPREVAPVGRRFGKADRSLGGES
jgi:hypothetical protein